LYESRHRFEQEVDPVACTTYVVCNGGITVTFADAHVGGIKVITGAAGGPFHGIDHDGHPVVGPPGPGPELQKRLVEAMRAFSHSAEQVTSVARELGARRQ
jgi:hypothetical protein